jgi:uncharacterized protein YjbI with pentapeptide repeats
LKLAILLTIALGGWYLSSINDDRQNAIASSNQQDAVIREYIKEMRGIALNMKVAQAAKRPGTEANGIARALTLTALSQLKGEGPDRRSLIFQFLRESGFSVLAGNKTHAGANLFRYDLRKTDLSKANLSRTDLSGANLDGADLRGAILYRANLNGADLNGANLSGAELSGANLGRTNLSGVNLSGAKFKDTICPDGRKTEKRCHVPHAP